MGVGEMGVGVMGVGVMGVGVMGVGEMALTPSIISQVAKYKEIRFLLCTHAAVGMKFAQFISI